MNLKNAQTYYIILYYYTCSRIPQSVVDYFRVGSGLYTTKTRVMRQEKKMSFGVILNSSFIKIYG